MSAPRLAKVSRRADILRLHGDYDVGTGRMPTHFEMVRKGIYRETDRAHCCVCEPLGRTEEIARLKARLAELEGRS